MSDLGALNTAIGPSPESKIKGDSSVFLWRGGLRLMRPRFWLPPTVLSLAVVTAVQYNYLPGHVLAELFSMMIAWVFFGLAWKTYALEGNRFLIMLGFGFFWIGAVDFLHMLAYKGMNLLPFTGANEATQLWVCARALQALTLVFCPLLARWGGSIWVAFLAIGALAIASAVAVFYGHFPQAFVEGEGLTTFKISAEYVIIALHAVSIALVARIPEAVLRSEDRAPIIYFIIISMISEFAFTLYVDVYGLANLVGHVLKIWAFWLIFDATIQINFDGPHWTLKRLSQVVEQSPAMVVITDRSGVVEYVNPQFQADTGYSADEAVGRHIDFLKSDEMPQRQIDEMWQVIGRGDIWHGYFRNRRKNGSLYWDKSTIAPIRDPRGNIQSYVAIKEDVTQKRQVEEFLLDSENAVTHTLIGALDAMVGLLEARDPYTAGHSRNVSAIALTIANEMKMPKAQIEGLRIAAMIHDVGKIQVPMDILNKPGRLTANEFELIKQHPQTAYDAIKEIPFPWDVPKIVLSHHEKWDGTGYPNGLKGEQIPLEAQILSVADVLDAVCARRPYRAQLGADKAFQIIEEGRGSSFSPTVVAAALRARERIVKQLAG